MYLLFMLLYCIFHGLSMPPKRLAQSSLIAQKHEIQAQSNVVVKITETSKEHLKMTSSIMEFLKKQGFNKLFRGASHELIDHLFGKPILFYLFIFLILDSINWLKHSSLRKLQTSHIHL